MKNKIVIDTNSLVILIVGLLDINLIGTHKRTSIYEESDFYNLVDYIQDINNLIVLPNI